MPTDHTESSLPALLPSRPLLLSPRLLAAIRQHLAAWIANVLLIGGVVLVSVQPTAAVGASVFFLFLAGHLFLVVHTARTRDLPMFVLNALLAALDVYAIALRL